MHSTVRSHTSSDQTKLKRWLYFPYQIWMCAYFQWSPILRIGTESSEKKFACYYPYIAVNLRYLCSYAYATLCTSKQKWAKGLGAFYRQIWGKNVCRSRTVSYRLCTWAESMKIYNLSGILTRKYLYNTTCPNYFEAFENPDTKSMRMSIRKPPKCNRYREKLTTPYVVGASASLIISMRFVKSRSKMAI